MKQAGPDKVSEMFECSQGVGLGLLGLGAGLGLTYLLGLPSPPVLQADHAVIEGVLDTRSS